MQENRLPIAKIKSAIYQIVCAVKLDWKVRLNFCANSLIIYVAFAKVHSRQYWLKRQKFNLLILQVFIKNQMLKSPSLRTTILSNFALKSPKVCKNWGCHSLKSFLPFVQRQQKYYTRYFFGTAKVIDGVPFWVARKAFRILPDFHALAQKKN